MEIPFADYAHLPASQHWEPKYSWNSWAHNCRCFKQTTSRSHWSRSCSSHPKGLLLLAAATAAAGLFPWPPVSSSKAPVWTEQPGRLLALRLYQFYKAQLMGAWDAGRIWRCLYLVVCRCLREIFHWPIKCRGWGMEHRCWIPKLTGHRNGA